MGERFVMNCTKCQLHKTRTNIVEFRGNLDATILIVGEAPGISEDILGLPFVGESGKLLDTLLTRAGVPLDICGFINTVMCRPCDERGGQNREPTESEIFNCIGNVMAIYIGLSKLKGIVFAGKISKKYYSKIFKGIPNISIIHPSFLYRQGGPASSHYRDAMNTLREFYDEIET
jgi:DNA polymerase